jgi:hypothetical protein
MPRGRPPNSEIRQRIVEILAHMEKDYGYNIFKLYSRIFPKVSMRLVYYHLNKGVELGIFRMERVENVEGDYSWGKTALKVFYSLGSNAMAMGSPEVDNFFGSKMK